MTRLQKPPIQVPFDDEGNQLHYPLHRWAYNPNHPDANSGGYYRQDPIIKDNYEFMATMKFEDIQRGRSAAYFHLTDAQGKKYTMFMTDLLDLLKRARRIESGEVTGKWTFCKRGANFGVKLVE